MLSLSSSWMFLSYLFFSSLVTLVNSQKYVSAMGDPLYSSSNQSVMITGWNFCNEALAPAEYPKNPSPRWADCANADGTSRVSAADNALGPGDAFPLPGFNATGDVNAYAVEKELFLGERCSNGDGDNKWSFHTIMLKSGNMNIAANICPNTSNGTLSESGGFNNLPMNQPVVSLSPAVMRSVPYNGKSLVGSVSATYDVDPSWTPTETAAIRSALDDYLALWIDYRFAEIDDISPLPPIPYSIKPALLANRSFEAAFWWKNITSGSTVFSLIQLCSHGAPWLMNYLKLSDASGFGGGYDFSSSGDLLGPVPSYETRLQLRFTQQVPSNLYTPCHGGCWKLDGSPCDGDLDSDVTRYICYLVNGAGACGTPSNPNGCPKFHIRSSDNTPILRGSPDFPYHCYSQHCAPRTNGTNACDPYSNPGPQELMMLYPCSEWAEHGYPSTQGGGNGELLNLDVGALGARVALAGEEPADVGAETRAARGWATLPPASQLPPYPGWSRSWNGFDFGAEMGLSGAVAQTETRYEWTEVNVLVLSS